MSDLPQRLAFTARNLSRAVRNEDGYRHVAGRDYAFRLLRRLTPLAAVEDDDGLRYLVSTTDFAVGRDTYLHRGYDADVMRRLVEVAAARLGRDPLVDRTFVDVGANIGTATVPALLRYGAAAGLAFEPAPDTFALLQCNLALNGLTERVQAVQVALSDSAGTATLEVSDVNWGDRRLRTDATPADGALGEASWATTEVRTARLDDLLGEHQVDLDRIGLVWIDTQGHEAKVLSGGSGLLERRPPMVIEYWPYGLRRSGGLEALHELLAGAYPEVIDVRADEFEALPSGRVGELAARYPEPGDYTDLLLLP